MNKVRISLNYKKNQILELKGIITEIKNILEVFSSRFEQAEERMSEPESKTSEITHSERQKEKRRKGNKACDVGRVQSLGSQKERGRKKINLKK